jgi:hypothetical protein
MLHKFQKRKFGNFRIDHLILVETNSFGPNYKILHRFCQFQIGHRLRGSTWMARLEPSSRFGLVRFGSAWLDFLSARFDLRINNNTNYKTWKTTHPEIVNGSFFLQITNYINRMMITMS